VLAFGALFATAMALRATALTMPEHYFGWLGAAAAVWLVGVVVWSVFLLPKLWRAPAGPPQKTGA
jgi:membrane protein YdbS with pleckstrin-like domain